MAMISLLLNARIIELYRRKRKSTAMNTYSNAHELEDPYKLGYYFVLKGSCNLVFEVLKLRKAVDSRLVTSQLSE